MRLRFKICAVVLLCAGICRCSLVMDSMSQKGIYLSDYCPKTPHCSEGAHVMCMYYNPNQKMGPRCNRPKNVSITPDLATKLLEVTNAIRSKIALGKEVGKDSIPFPKGYGMHRLSWDSELATFAQVLANQCILRHDMCRATKQFPDPGQTAGLVRFTYPDWIPVSKTAPNQRPGFTMSKLSYAITQILKSWYWQKSAVSLEMMQSYPHWAGTPNNQAGRLYMEMIQGPSTHMGCGVSAYTEYAFYDNNGAMNYNSVEVICNYSSKGKSGKPSYDLEAPKEVGYTIRCGCPPGMEEDENCLCYESPRIAITDSPNIGRIPCTGAENCKPAVVLLPIFTVENAPPEKLIGRTNAETGMGPKEIDFEIQDMYEPSNVSVLHPASNLQRQNDIHSVISRIVQQEPSISHVKTAIISKPFMKDVKNRFFDKTKHSISSYRSKYDHRQRKKSIFAEAPTFNLFRNIEAKAMPIVQPRRDFSKAKNLVKQYVDHRKRGNDIGFKKIGKFSNTHQRYTKSNLSSAEEKVISYNYYLNNNTKPRESTHTKGSLSDFELDSSLEKSDKNLMHLLDKLEQEVNHIELDGSKKEIFDAKIRKIYGTVLGKPVDLLDPKLSDKSEFTDYEMIDNKYNNRRYSDDDVAKKIHEKLSNTHVNRKHHESNYANNKMESLTRRRNALLLSESDNEYDENFKKTKDIIHSYAADDKKDSHRTRNHFHDNNEIKMRSIISDNEGKEKRYYSDTEDRRPHDIVDKRKRTENYDDPLSTDRRKYYQSKLENIEKKLRTTRFKHHKDSNNQQMRPIMPTTRNEEPLRSAKSQLDPFYMPDRARFLHGF